ncbi:hypothetical protein [Paenarthrobacter sp. NPDC090522]|uniref:hypothetical protein n=1 Tax=Paenarthrobacter sp. NPDC090522 TaxID=3364383 RepID=UPI003804BD71
MANAKTSLRRLEKRQDALEAANAPMSKITRGMNRIVAAVTRLGEREQHAIPATNDNALPAPQPTRAGEITPETVNAASWDDIGGMYSTYGDDPEALEKLQLLVEEREEREAADVWGTGTAPTVGEGDALTNPTLREERKLTPHEVAREEYDNYVYAQYRKCESELSFMVNKQGQAKGIDSFSLFQGPVSRVKKYGSEELQAWFAANGRHTLGSFRHAMFGWASDAKAARNARLEGFENVAHTF